MTDSYTEHIKHYMGPVLNGLIRRLQEQGEIAQTDLRLLEPSTCDYHPLTLLTGDTTGSHALFMRILQLMALNREKATTVIVPEDEALDLTNSIVSTQLCMDITSNSREWMNIKYFDSFFYDFKLITESKIKIVDAPSLNASLAQASDHSDLDYLFVTGFPGNDPDEELRTLKGFAVGRNIPVLVLNTGKPVDRNDLCKHIETYYHMEKANGLEYKLTVGSYRLKKKEEATVMLNATKKWIDTINDSCLYSMNANAKPDRRAEPSTDVFKPSIYQDHEQ